MLAKFLQKYIFQSCHAQKKLQNLKPIFLILVSKIENQNVSGYKCLVSFYLLFILHLKTLENILYQLLQNSSFYIKRLTAKIETSEREVHSSFSLKLMVS